MPEITLDKGSLEQLHLQVANSIGKSIVKNRIKVGTALPYEIWIAEEFGINRNTVHKAYEKLISDGFAEKLDERKGIFVSDTAKKKYMPAFPAIGIVTSGNFSDLVYKSTQNSLAYFSGVIDRATETKHSAIFLHLPDAEDKAGKTQQWIDDTVPRLSGIVHFGRDFHKNALPLRLLLENKQIPQVLISAFSLMSHISSVYGDVFSGGTAAADLLRDNGHRRVGILSSFIPPQKDDLFNYYAGVRAQMMEECFRKCNLRVDPGWVSIYPPKENILKTNIKKILAMKEHPTAFWCQNDYTAIEAIKIINDLGLNVPGDISIIGFDDVKEGASCNPPLTTIRQPCYSIGQNAVDLLIDIFENESPGEARTVKTPTSLVERGSVARVAGGR
jgi:DNA-binding LacI/PurR family transcriptional regulator/DNA-binding transcriptional regulator YhcF (GntR family)